MAQVTRGSPWRIGRDGPSWSGSRPGPAGVGELARELPVSRPAVSQHLKVLKCAGLVHDRAAGTRRVYQLDPTGLEALRADLDRFWTQALATYASKFNQGDDS